MSTSSTNSTIPAKRNFPPLPNTPETKDSSTTNTEEKSNTDPTRKKKLPPNPGTPPKLTSLSPKSSSFRMNAPSAPKSPRALKKVKNDECPLPSSSETHSSTKKNQRISSLSTISETNERSPIPASVPILRIVKAKIPSDIVKKLEIEHTNHVFVQLVIGDICKQSINLDDRHSIGRTDSAFYIDHLPDVLKLLAKGTDQKTVSSSKLMQRFFLEEFRKNTGWASAKIFYANEMFNEKSRITSPLGETDPSTKNIEREKFKKLAEVISRAIFGNPPTIKNSPLPDRLIDVLIYADQQFHEKLLEDTSAKDWTIDQIRDARYSLIKLLTVTRLIMPMMTGLAEKNPSQTEIWCLGILMQTLENSAMELSKDILIESFKTAPNSLQELARDKERKERIQKRTHEIKAKNKKYTRHIRSKSAETKIVDINWLEQRNEVRTKRANEKTKMLISKFDFDDDDYTRVINDTSNTLKENEEVAKAESILKDFSIDDFEELQKMLDERDETEMMNLIPYGEIMPERAQPLPVSTTDPIPNALSYPVEKDNPPVASFTAEPQPSSGVSQE